jgi:methyl-accepting chemotaxis protein
LISWLTSLISVRNKAAKESSVDSAIAQKASDPTFLAKSRSWHMTFSDLARELIEISKNTENEFLAIGSNLHAIADGCNGISARAGSLVRADEGSGGFSVEKFEQLFRKAIESTGVCAAAIPTGLVEMASLKDRLEEIAGLRTYLEGLSRTITVIGVLTRIETARLEGTDFNTMTTVVDDLAQQIAQSTASIASSAADAKTSIEEISNKMVEELEAYKMEATQAGEHINDILSEMNEMKMRCGWACKRIDGRSGQMIPEIGEIVMALQSHDITRQQMEHVAHTLQDAAGKVEGMAEATDSEMGSLKKWVDDVLRIQLLQLDDVIAKTAAAAGAISGHLSRISDLSEAQAEDSSLILEEEESGKLRIERIMAEMDALMSLNARCKAMTTDMLRAVSDASGRVGTMSEHVANIVSISDNISLLAMNALIKVARTGDAGRALAVLADKIMSLSLQAREEIGKGTEKINSILASTAEFRDTLSGSLMKHLATADNLGEESRAAAPELIAADKAMIGSIDEIAKTTNDLKADIGQLVSNIRFDETIKTGIGAVVLKLRAVHGDIVETIPDVAGITPQAPTAHLDELAKRYTMESEREAHNAVVEEAHRLTGPAADESAGKNGRAKGKTQEEIGENVELF